MSQGAHDIFVLVIKNLKTKTSNQNMSILDCLKQKKLLIKLQQKI